MHAFNPSSWKAQRQVDLKFKSSLVPGGATLYLKNKIKQLTIIMTMMIIIQDRIRTR